MGYVLDPAKATQREIRRVARERLGDAIERLDAVIAGHDTEIETAVHEVRKRCKEARGLARLARPAIGDAFGPFDRTVRAAANQLSAMRDAHALLVTIDTVRSAAPDAAADTDLAVVREHQRAVASAATASIEAGDVRIAAARNLLVTALELSQRWHLDDDALSVGLTATYRTGRRSLRRAERRPTDHRLHEWRKSVKYLWYQLRLLHDASPSVIGPIVAQLDALADALGDDHDLAVLVEQLDAESEQFGPAAAVVRGIARAHQATLRERAFRAGAVVYTETDWAFGERVAAYWRLTAQHGPEHVVGGIATLAASDPAPDTVASPFERERKFLLDRLPNELDLSDPVLMRQGYLASSGHASVRIRDAGVCTLTVKAGIGAERVELEWPIDRSSFDAAWPFTDGQRVTKTRHRVPLGTDIVEIDVFEGALEGLLFAEVEFSTLEELESFEPPAWFGRELTDDARFNNAALALHGLPPDLHSPT